MKCILIKTYRYQQQHDNHNFPYFKTKNEEFSILSTCIYCMFKKND